MIDSNVHSYSQYFSTYLFDFSLNPYNYNFNMNNMNKKVDINDRKIT